MPANGYYSITIGYWSKVMHFGPDVTEMMIDS